MLLTMQCLDVHTGEFLQCIDLVQISGLNRPCKKYCVSQQKWVSLATLFLDRRLTHGCFFTVASGAARK